MSTGAPAEDPFELFSGLGAQFGVLLLLAAVAIAVVFVSRRLTRARARGRARRRPDWADPQWRAKVEALRASPTPIAEARSGDVCVIATLTSAPAALGGDPQHACVWRNISGGDAATAIAAELVFVADDSGRAALEQLEHARVIAPHEPGLAKTRIDPHVRRMAALYLGDVVEICGCFAVDRVGDDPDPRKLVYGTLGHGGPLEIRVIERPARPAAPDAPDEAPPRPADEGTP